MQKCLSVREQPFQMVEIHLLLLLQLLLLNSNHNHGGGDGGNDERCAKLQKKKVQLMKFAKALVKKLKKVIRAFYIKKVIFCQLRWQKYLRNKLFFPFETSGKSSQS